MPWFPDELTQNIVLATVGVVGAVLLVYVARFFGRIRRRRRYSAGVKAEQRAVAQRRAEVERIAGQIVATSSTGDIRGYAIQRQIEAVVTDGHASPADAMRALKFEAACKGGNAVINLVAERTPANKCLARGDVVIVERLDETGAAAGDASE